MYIFNIPTRIWDIQTFHVINMQGVSESFHTIPKLVNIMNKFMSKEPPKTKVSDDMLEWLHCTWQRIRSIFVLEWPKNLSQFVLKCGDIYWNLKSLLLFYECLVHSWKMPGSFLKLSSKWESKQGCFLWSVHVHES